MGVGGGDRLKGWDDGYYIAAALVAETAAKMRVNQEEIFGPVATVLRVADYEEALAIANDVEFGLSAGIVTSSFRHAHDFMARAQAGMEMVNLPTDRKSTRLKSSH